MRLVQRQPDDKRLLHPPLVDLAQQYLLRFFFARAHPILP